MQKLPDTAIIREVGGEEETQAGNESDVVHFRKWARWQVGKGGHSWPYHLVF